MQSSTPYRPNPTSRQQATDASEPHDHCPYLGAATDAATYHEFPSDVNKCYSTRLAVPVSVIHQENYCLSPRFESCPVYRERAKRAGGAPIVSPAVIAAASASSPLAWPETTAAPEFDPMPWESVVSDPIVAPVTDDQSLDSGEPLLFPWEQDTHPDFQADMAAEPYRWHSRRVNLRPVLVGLLLLGLIPLVWWLWTNVRPSAGNEAEAVGGTVVTLPTLMTTSDAGEAAGGRSAAVDLPPATGEPEALVVGAADEPAAEPTATDLEKIAATATALFVNATPVTDCVAPSWWVAYLVEEGDTLEALAETRGISVEELIVANCLAGPDLAPGLTLLLPPVGVIALEPEASPTPTATATRVSRPPGSPTRVPVLLPTPTFPVVIILTPLVPTVQATEQPENPTPDRPTESPPVVPTSTAPNPFSQPTSTPSESLTSTPEP